MEAVARTHDRVAETVGVLSVRKAASDSRGGNRVAGRDRVALRTVSTRQQRATARGV